MASSVDPEEEIGGIPPLSNGITSSSSSFFPVVARALALRGVFSMPLQHSSGNCVGDVKGNKLSLSRSSGSSESTTATKTSSKSSPDASFTKHFSFSPDGSMGLTVQEDQVVKTWGMPVATMYRDYCKSSNSGNSDSSYSDSSSNDNSNSSNDSKSTDDPLPPSDYIYHHNTFAVGEAIYDAKWYPLMRSDTLNTVCFLTTSRDHPIHLWDAIGGGIRSSYSGYDQYDELDTALSVAFNLDGSKIYAGYNRMIRCFDINYPGKNYTDIPTCKSRRDKDGQKGIISALSFNPDFSKTYAAGSYSDSVGIYVEDEQESVLEIRDLDIGGVSSLHWSSCGNMLWLGGRCCDDIICWDVRSFREELGRVARPLSTSQRVHFDLDNCFGGRYLATGSQQGDILIYDTKTFGLVQRLDGSNMTIGQGNCIHSVEFHPYYHYLASCNGQRHFITDDDDCDDNSDVDDDSNVDDDDDDVVKSSGSEVARYDNRNSIDNRKSILAVEGGSDFGFSTGDHISDILSRKKAKICNTNTNTNRTSNAAASSEIRLWAF